MNVERSEARSARLYQRSTSARTKKGTPRVPQSESNLFLVTFALVPNAVGASISELKPLQWRLGYAPMREGTNGTHRSTFRLGNLLIRRTEIGIGEIAESD